ncbi:regulator of G-protein signaling 1 isoform X3 [Phragmites australis]|uniref:regulator of G-protein signaling 1 isoform X3 n=1 Tax=Phragmites australis TaxID=29695 RepID=UPI002D7952A8|nr:regulator of G-protein signaling 1 isoform X3 [Phragmites australis]
MGGGCALSGGCSTDYAAVAIASAALALRGKKYSGIWLVIVQIVGSIDLLLSLVMSINFLKIKHGHPWKSCYLWAVWAEGPFGFGLLMSCRIVQGFQLYHFFVKHRLPPIRPSIMLVVILLPWICGAAVFHWNKPLNHRCHMQTQWVIPVMCIHGLYIACLVGITLSIRHIEFRFSEFKDLLQAIIVSTIAVGFWIVAYVMNEIHEDIPWVQIFSRFSLLVMASILVLLFFSMSVSQPLHSQIRLRKQESSAFMTMGEALGITGRGSVKKINETHFDQNHPLDKLLENKRFRMSFMSFADRPPGYDKSVFKCSYFAGESVHFYEEVYDLKKIPVDDSIRRIYMSRHIIEKYIVTGAEMEINISHRTHQEILGTSDLTHPNLFDNAVAEILQLIKLNLAKDYWLSMHFVKLKEEMERGSNVPELMPLDYSPRVSFVRCTDDPFCEEHTANCN